jgi:hypothetical protein
VTLSKREKYIAIGMGTAIAIWGLDALLLSPYIDQRSSLVAQQDVGNQRLKDATVLFARRQSLQKIWNDMQKGGLKSDTSAADTQAQHAVLDWFNGSGVNLVALKSDPHISQEGKFQVIKYHIQGEATMRQAAMLLWAMETATIPVRVDDLSFKPRGKEGMDDLTVELGISTLSINPDADKPSKPAVTLANFGSERS